MNTKQEEMNAKQDEMNAKQEEINAKQDATDRKITAMSEKFASVNITDLNIIPSETCSTKNIDIFTHVLDWLKLDSSPNFIDRTTPYEFVESPFEKWVKFSWEDKEESEGYQPLCEYLTRCNLIVRNVSNGQYLPAKVLYDEHVYSLRDRLVDGLTLCSENKIPIYKFRIRGRTDIVVLDEDLLGRSHVNFAVEVKTVKGMDAQADENQALREAFLQLIGLNVGNCYKSPAVVLTNLNAKHYVLYLKTAGDPEVSLRFTLKIHKSAELNKILHFANELSKRPSCTGRLGTVLTPPPSEREEEERYGNVEIRINPLEGLEGLDSASST